MKKLLALIILISSVYTLDAQQIHQLSQYALNDFIFNPAIAGKSHELEMKLNYRKQWAGFGDNDSPSTFAVSGHTNFTESKSVGLGLTIYTDKTGPTKRGGGVLSYAYHLPLKEEKHHISFGLATSLQRNTIDYTLFEEYDEGDPRLLEGTASKMSLDFNFGTYAYGDKYFVGASIAQIMGTGITLTDDVDDSKESDFDLARHFYGMAGYRWDINEDFALQPMVLIKGVKAAPVQFDFTGRFMYQKQYWIGASYRTQDAVSLLAGVELNNGINLAYSYDFTTSRIKDVSSGTHEITLGYDLNWRKK